MLLCQNNIKKSIYFPLLKNKRKKQLSLKTLTIFDEFKTCFYSKTLTKNSLRSVLSQSI